MIKSKNIPSSDYLRECFDYVDGCLIWRNRPKSHFKTKRAYGMWNAKNAGNKAGRVLSGLCEYIQIGLDNKRYLAHRLILAMHGVQLGEVVDHINGCGTDNRIENLRVATQKENAKNHSGWKKKSIRPGVFELKNGKFSACIRINGKQKSLGRFNTVNEAIDARVIAERIIYGEFSVSASRGVVWSDPIADERMAA